MAGAAFTPELQEHSGFASAEKELIGERPAQRRAVSVAVPVKKSLTTYGTPPGGTVRRRTDVSGLLERISDAELQDAWCVGDGRDLAERGRT